MSDTTDADMPEVISTDRVPLANRYAGAWFEYNNRVMARHNLTTMYISAATILIGFLYSITDKPLPEDKTARDSVRPIIMATTFALPGISIIYAAFMFMHDGIMSGLHHYMVYCERIGNDGRGALPSYHLDDIWNRNFFKYRWIQNAIGVGPDPTVVLPAATSRLTGLLFTFRRLGVPAEFTETPQNADPWL
jgi:hypothetical protein